MAAAVVRHLSICGRCSPAPVCMSEAFICSWAPVQVYHAVLHGERPRIPSRKELPGPDPEGFAGLDAYCQLIRWVLVGCAYVLARCTHVVPVPCAGTAGSMSHPSDPRLPTSCRDCAS